MTGGFLHQNHSLTLSHVEREFQIQSYLPKTLASNSFILFNRKNILNDDCKVTITSLVLHDVYYTAVNENGGGDKKADQYRLIPPKYLVCARRKVEKNIGRLFIHENMRLKKVIHEAEKLHLHVKVNLNMKPLHKASLQSQKEYITTEQSQCTHIGNKRYNLH